MRTPSAPPSGTVSPAPRRQTCLKSMMGASGANTASTEVVLSNTDPDPSECEVALLFHRGISQAPPVRFNGRPEEGNLIHVTISREGAAIVTLTAPEASGLLSGGCLCLWPAHPALLIPSRSRGAP